MKEIKFLNTVVRVPQAFVIDHSQRGLVTPSLVRANHRYFWIDSANPAFIELLDDALFYAAPGTDSSWMTIAAQSFLAALEKQFSQLPREAAVKVQSFYSSKVQS